MYQPYRISFGDARYIGEIIIARSENETTMNDTTIVLIFIISLSVISWIWSEYEVRKFGL